MKINIHRSSNNRVVAGVLGGLSEHFGWKAGRARLIFLILSITPIFPGIIVYLIGWLIMKDPINYNKHRKIIN
ncbi:PspC domain-containing protein [Pediococcus pentosaceus]|jgi:phage shock protein PspC (stress-responsive transcriptional regulator)|uniref:PspC domain-containing protein n=1 Tax=Pediococcus pentosaceus TaxID=1255 RepID=UPI0021A6B348|nr:PspC domain-containing protein [Pediococcus pentosaceus]MCT3033276.1 PspC domain-containing protein [Pediococcus pentosaceus]